MDQRDINLAHRVGDDLHDHDRGSREDARQQLGMVLHDRDALKIITEANRSSGGRGDRIAVSEEGQVNIVGRDRQAMYVGQSRELAEQLYYENRNNQGRYPNQNYPDGNGRRNDVPPYYSGDDQRPRPYYDPNQRNGGYNDRNYGGQGQGQGQVPWELDPRNHSNGRSNPYGGRNAGNSDGAAAAAVTGIIIDAITGRRRY